MENLTLDKWTIVIEIVVAEPNNTISYIAKKCKCTYAHVASIITLLAENKLITTEHIGRSTFINPTKDGEIVAKAISTILYIVEEQK